MSAWTYTYTASGYTILFHGQAVWGLAVRSARRRVRVSYLAMAQQARREAELCRKLHATFPFQPGRYRHYQHWLQEARAV